MGELSNLVTQAEKDSAVASDEVALQSVRSAYLGPKSRIVALLKSLSSLPKEERPKQGAAIHQTKQAIEAHLLARKTVLEAEAWQHALTAESIDVSLPARSMPSGSLHPITLAQARITSFFLQLGFTIAKGPEIETEHYNFTALNVPQHHPARAGMDTFYFPNGLLLRAHTSSVQIRAMEKSEAPVRFIAPGRVYRRDSDMTHTPMFHQVEGLYIDEHATFAHLKHTLHAFFRFYFDKEELELRFRPSYFPFTEPSAEVDIQCVRCSGSGCQTCQQSGWLEVLGCGMVHPNVLTSMGVDKERYTGWAFGMGIDRLAMLRYDIGDLRILFENDVQFLQQF